MKIRRCTLYDRKIKQIHMISYKLNMYMPWILPSLPSLLLSSVLMFPLSIRYFFYRHGKNTLKYSDCLRNHLNFFRLFSQTIWIFSDCLAKQSEFFQIFGLTKTIPFLFVALYFINQPILCQLLLATNTRETQGLAAGAAASSTVLYTTNV